MRPLLALLCAACALALEYDPKPDQIALYEWTLKQTAQWQSAGDKLRFDTAIVWRLALRCAAIEGPRMRLAATFVSVAGSHRGPGVEAKVDSETGAGADDPLLGHLLALAGKTLTFEVERATGVVVKAEGGDEIIAAINRRAPAIIPGDPPPLDAATRAVYGPDALARLWSQVLALPTAQPAVIALAPPFTAGAAVERTWKDLAWTATVPAGAAAPAFELSRDPSPVRGEVKGLAGSGRIELKQGLPARAEGKLAFTLVMQALTQPVESTHSVEWTLIAR